MPRSTLLALILLAAPALTHAAAPPPPLPISRWVRELGSADGAARKAAAEGLWKAGPAALPALREAAGHRDRDLARRAGAILAKLEWGIRHDTPADVAGLIERYRDGDGGQRRAAADQLLRLGPRGFAAIGALLAREADRSVKADVAARLQALGRPAARAAILRGDPAGAGEVLAAAARTGDAAAERDLAVFLTLTDRAEQTAEALETRGESPRTAALLYRAVGDLERAGRLAEKSGDSALWGCVLEEQEDFKGLAKLDLPAFRSPGHRACLLWRAGDREGCEALLGRYPDAAAVAAVRLFNGQPRDGIRALLRAGQTLVACRLLLDQGRHREALALRAPGDGKAPAAAWMLLEQALAAEQTGDTPRRRELAARSLAVIGRHLRDHPSLLGRYLQYGRSGRWLDEAVRDAGELLDADRAATLSAEALRPFVAEDAEAFALWWDYFRGRKPAPRPSASLRRLAGWFVDGKADADFDATLADARQGGGAKAGGERWAEALARACLRVGRLKEAEEILKEAAAAGTARGHDNHANFLFVRGRWAEAAEAYGEGLKLSPGVSTMLYLRGVSLIRADRIREGLALVERARLLPLGDDEARAAVADRLDRLGLNDEATAERLLVARTADLRSPAVVRVLGPLAARAAREGRHLDAARYYRRQLTAAAFEGGGFADARMLLRLPALAHLHQGRGLVAAGRLGEALEEERRLREVQPEEPGLAAELVRALDAAGRRAEADEFFGRRFALFQRDCVEYPLFAERHHRLAWFASRTRRRMDRGLLHAGLLVRLMPGSAVYHAALAELHFQRGDKDEALAAIRKAEGLAPGERYYAAQRRRIEAGDREAAIIPRR